METHGVAHEPRKGLVIDDQQFYRDTYTRFLVDAGLSVTVSDSLEHARGLINDEYFHVAAIDLSLVGDRNRDGLAVVKCLTQEAQEGTSAILMTAFGDVEIGADAARLGAYKVMRKENVEPAEFIDICGDAYREAVARLSTIDMGLSFLCGHGDATNMQIRTAEVCALLAAGPFDYVDRFVQTLLWTVVPLSRRRIQPEATIDRNGRLVEAHFWSALLGVPISVALGAPESVKEYISRRVHGAGVGTTEIVREINSAKISGVIVAGRDRRSDYEPRLRQG